MMLATADFFRPVVRTEYLDRLAVLAEGPVVPEFWDDVHAEVQAQLAQLEADVRRRLPEIRVDAGRTQGDHFVLFSYRTFTTPHSGIDPVVAGITFTLAEQGVTLEADISGEQTGDWIAAASSRTVAHCRGDVLEAARESLRTICESADAIATAINDPSRCVD